MNLESALWMLIRVVLGVFLATAFSAAAWVLSRYFPMDTAEASTAFFAVQSLIVGVPAGVGAAAAWWTPDSPARMRLIRAAAIPPATALCALLAIQIRGVETYYGLFAGSHRILVVETGDLLGALIIASVISANIIAAAFYLHGYIRRREI